jgi:putative membrane protein
MMHYVMGIGTGTLYGALSECTLEVTAGGGLLWGGAVWLLGDEATVPALGLSKSLAAYPASSHLYALASHLVYGMTAELVRRIVRRVL